MTKFLVTDLLTPRVVKTPRKAKSSKGLPKVGKSFLVIVLFMVLMILAAVGWFVVRPQILAKKGQQQQIAESEPEPVQPAKQTPNKPPKKPIKKPRGKGLEDIPWMCFYKPLLNSIPRARGNLYSIVSGPEGVLLFSGVVPGENVEIDPKKPLLPGMRVENPKIIEVNPVDGGVNYVVQADMIPMDEIDFDPEPIPPYMRGQMLRQIDSTAKAFELSDVSSEPIGNEDVKNGSRYLISLKAQGSLEQIKKFVEKMENSGKMLEIGQISLEGMEQQPLISDEIRLGLVFRLYNIELNIPENKPEISDTLKTTDSIETAKSDTINK